jgi:hypothetical protein
VEKEPPQAFPSGAATQRGLCSSLLTHVDFSEIVKLDATGRKGRSAGTCTPGSAGVGLYRVSAFGTLRAFYSHFARLAFEKWYSSPNLAHQRIRKNALAALFGPLSHITGGGNFHEKSLDPFPADRVSALPHLSMEIWTQPAQAFPLNSRKRITALHAQT